MIKTIATEYKVLDVGEKASDGTPAKAAGQVEMIVSVFGNQDSYGDVINKGAFNRTLAEWDAKGDPIPVFYSHQLSDPFANIGWSLDAKEVPAKSKTPPGLWTLTQMDLDNPTARQTLKLMQERRLTSASFSYTVAAGGEKYVEPEDPKADPWETGDFGHFELTDITLYEYGPTPIGANPEATILPMKSGGVVRVPTRLLAARAKVGKVLSSKNLTALSDARDLLDQVIADANAPEPGKSESHVIPRRRSVTVTGKAFPPADPNAPAADPNAPAPTMDDVASDVQDAADSLASALDSIDSMMGGGKAVELDPTDGGKSASEDQGSGPAKAGKAQDQGLAAELDRLNLYASSLVLERTSHE